MDIQHDFKELLGSGVKSSHSHCLVGGLLLTAPLLAKATPGFLKPDPFIARELIPRWKRWGYEGARAVWATLSLSAALSRRQGVSGKA